jgi:hypothetical protein
MQVTVLNSMVRGGKEAAKWSPEKKYVRQWDLLEKDLEA